MSKLQDQLAAHEGNLPYVYKDHLGYETIGIGFLVDKRKGGGLRPEEIEFIFNNRVRLIAEELERRVKFMGALNDARYAVMINMAYQLGVNGLIAFKKTIDYIGDGFYEKAAKEMLDSTWAKQTPKRAKEMSEQMRTGKWQ